MGHYLSNQNCSYKCKSVRNDKCKTEKAETAGKADFEPVKIAVIGAGQPNIATSNHLPAIAKTPSVKLVGLCDINESGVRKEADKWKVKYYTDIEELLKDDEIELVDICTPDQFHCEHTILAARAGKHILCEKPMAISLEQADRMIAEVKRAGVKFMVAQQRRFTNKLKKMKAAIDEGKIGKPVFGRVAFKGAFFPYPKESFYYKKASGGQFVHNGPHLVDSLFFLLGQTKAKRVHKKSRSFYPSADEKMETDNYTSVTLEFPDGSIGSIEQNLMMINPRGYPTREEILIIGTKGTISWNSLDDSPVFQYVYGSVIIPDPMRMKSEDDPYSLEIDYLAKCIRFDIEPEMNAEYGRNVLEVCV